MDLEAFKKSLQRKALPRGLSGAAAGLWWDAKGDWQKAHVSAQGDDGTAGAWVHAYLHRKEGDQANAGYWYRRAGKAPATGPLAEEWQAIARAFLREG